MPSFSINGRQDFFRSQLVFTPSRRMIARSKARVTVSIAIPLPAESFKALVNIGCIENVTFSAGKCHVPQKQVLGPKNDRLCSLMVLHMYINS